MNTVMNIRVEKLDAAACSQSVSQPMSPPAAPVLATVWRQSQPRFCVTHCRTQSLQGSHPHCRTQSLQGTHPHGLGTWAERQGTRRPSLSLSFTRRQIVARLIKL
jgi:hypothetical protein